MGLRARERREGERRMLLGMMWYWRRVWRAWGLLVRGRRGEGGRGKLQREKVKRLWSLLLGRPRLRGRRSLYRAFPIFIYASALFSHYSFQSPISPYYLAFSRNFSDGMVQEGMLNSGGKTHIKRMIKPSLRQRTPKSRKITIQRRKRRFYRYC